jgi:hypothetical protein
MAQQMGTPSASTPPPLPQAVMFHVAIGGQQAGPFDANAIAQRIAAGDITRETLVWKPGMVSWTPASQVAELQSHFGQVPPPLPPTS